VSSLTEILRNGARELLARAVEIELQVFLETTAELKLPDEAFASRSAVGPTPAYAGVKALLREWDQTGITGVDKITIRTIAPIMQSDEAKAAIVANVARSRNRIR
jgi:hypothetical protein